MKKVQDFIEETDIRLSIAPDDAFTIQDLDEAVQQVFNKYNTARDTAEMNKPSSYAHQNQNVADGKKNDQTDDDATDGTGTNAGPVGTIVKTVQNKLAEDPTGKGKNKLAID